MQKTFPIPAVLGDDLIDESFPYKNRNTVNLPKTRRPSLDSISNEIEKYFQSYSPETVKAYRADLYSYFTFIDKPVQNTTKADVLNYLKKLEDNGYRNASINRKLASLSKILSIYVSMELMDSNPVQTLASVGKLYKPVDNQVSIKVTRHDIDAVIANGRKKTAVIVKFLCNTGLRVSEMTGLTKSDLEPFNSDYMRLRVLGKGKKQRFVFISYKLYQEIKDLYDGDSVYLFASRSGQRLSRVNIYKQIRRSFLKHTMKDGITPHMLRHWFANTKIIDEKKDYKAVSTYLGHASVSTTLSIYTHNQLQPEETEIL